MSRFSPDALFCKFDNGVGADVDKVDVGEVVDFVVLVTGQSGLRLLGTRYRDMTATGGSKHKLTYCSRDGRFSPNP